MSGIPSVPLPPVTVTGKKLSDGEGFQQRIYHPSLTHLKMQVRRMQNSVITKTL